MLDAYDNNFLGPLPVGVAQLPKLKHLDSGDSLACKSIDKLILADDSIDRQCIDKEAKIMQFVFGHSNIVQIFDVYEDDTHLEIILEL